MRHLSCDRCPQRKKHDQEARAAEPWNGRRQRSPEGPLREKRGEGGESGQWTLETVMLDQETGDYARGRIHTRHGTAADEPDEGGTGSVT